MTVNRNIGASFAPERPALSWEEAVDWLRAQPDQVDLVRACFFDDPLLGAAERFRASAEWLATRRLFPGRSGRALDVGAGRGIASYAMAMDGWEVTAVEPDRSGLVGADAIRSLASEAKLSIKVVEAFGEKLPFADASFDLVLCRQALHHAQDLRALCSEVGRVLRPGGTMVATREHVLSRNEDLESFLRAHPLHRLYGGENAFRLSDYEQAIRAAGLLLVRALNPYESEINLFPESLEEVRSRVARRLLLPRRWVSDRLMSFLGARLRSAGRLYSFVARKPERGA